MSYRKLIALACIACVMVVVVESVDAASSSGDNPKTREFLTPCGRFDASTMCRAWPQNEGADTLRFARKDWFTNYLLPYNMHLTSGATSAVPLSFVDRDGNPVTGTPSFFGYNNSLISIDENGYVTALRAENTNEIGTWVQATLDGDPVANTCIIRILSTDYGFSYIAETGENTILYYPTTIDGEDIAAYVVQYQIPLVTEYAYTIQSNIMDLAPFNGARQIFEIDFGETEEQRVCGISGNPIRLGWNIQGDEWRNCFLVPFIQPRSPQWFVFYHELGHNMTWPSIMFGQGLGPVVSYSEGLASAISLKTMRQILDEPTQYPANDDARNSMELVLDMNGTNYLNDFANWLGAGAPFANLDANIVDGLWLTYESLRGEDFAERFFLPLQPQFASTLSPLLDSINLYGDDARHTFFAALMSAALEENRKDEFRDTYHYPLLESLYDSAYITLSNLIARITCDCGHWGDLNADGFVNAVDVVILVNYVYKNQDSRKPLPNCPQEPGDVNCSNLVNAVDVVLYVNYVYKSSGAWPCTPCAP